MLGLRRPNVFGTVVGAVTLWARRSGGARPRLHRMAGHAWVLLMLVTAISALCIRDYQLPNLAGYTPIHLLVPLLFAGLLVAFGRLARRDIAVRVVSMPSTSVFDRQTPDYKEMVLPSELPRIAVEMGVSDYWWKYGCAAVVGIDSFGESAPAETLYEHFGFTPENVADTVQAVLGR